MAGHRVFADHHIAVLGNGRSLTSRVDKNLRQEHPPDHSDQTGTDDNHREGNPEEEDSDKGEARESHHDPVSERLPADPDDRGGDHRYDGRLET